LSTKIHHACDGKGRPLVMLLGLGQGGDSPMFPHVLAAIHVPRHGPGGVDFIVLPDLHTRVPQLVGTHAA